ncbi:MAG: hypothetical protein CVU73_06180 [Deltaproteobacteria bacterium HGW-Deltaproteobacteria-8]|jgi:glycosyltransferase involved in cell wall biosynthesis|nr:MAG: hypothetical protein CVU73_06180 [Deltaproteobacteria bacterium HGW-Deltaproteobacteria-8]
MRAAPRFSILVPTFNQAHYLGQALDSLLAQTCGDFEALVVDDGSVDDTPQVLAAYAARDERVRPFRRDNGGCGAALNTGLEQARGAWVGWLSSDDLFEPDKLAVHAQAILQHPEAGFFHTHFYYLDEATGEKSSPDPWRPVPPAHFQVSRLLEGNYVHGNAVMVRKDVFDEVGSFDESLRYGQDFDMWLRMSARHRSVYLEARTCVTRWHSGQTTNLFPVAGLYDSCRACLNFLNAFAFAGLFPQLNLAHPDEAAAAVDEVLGIVCNTGAYIYQLGYNTLLPDRLREWLGTDAASAAQAAREVLRQRLSRPQTQALPRVILQSLAAALEQTDAWAFTPRGVEQVIADTLADPATPEQKRQNLLRYREYLAAAHARLGCVRA